MYHFCRSTSQRSTHQERSIVTAGEDSRVSVWPLPQSGHNSDGAGMDTREDRVESMDIDDAAPAASRPSRGSKRERDMETDVEPVERPEIRKRVKSVGLSSGFILFMINQLTASSGR